MVKAVIFDMFETLVSLFHGKTYFSEDIASDIGIDLGAYRGPWHDTEDDRTLGRMSIEEGIGYALRAIDMYSEAEVEMIAGKRRGSLADTFSMIPEETVQLLQGLHDRGIKIGLISNCFSDEAEMIKNSRIYPLFDVALLSYEQGVAKPDPAIYKRMIERLGVNADECIYVGDGGSRELFTAREVGMKPIQVLWFRPIMLENHVPSPVYEEFPHAEKQADVLNYLDF